MSNLSRVHSLHGRRSFLSAGLTAGAVFLIGCSRKQAGESDETGAADARAQAAVRPPMKVHRDPGCGCCEAWARIAEQSGYAVQLINEADMPGLKSGLGVPVQLASCHTTEVGGFTIEGHVPIALVDRLLRERPKAVKGLAVPGMPLGSPGMEVPSGQVDDYRTYAFDAAGRIAVFG